MKVSYEWLREYVPTKIRAANLADQLTTAGLEVTSLQQRKDDFIFEIEVTPNRSDCLSYIGIAREIAAITKKPLKHPAANLVKHIKAITKTPKVTVKDQKLCPRYTARVIVGVVVKPSPKWLVKKIESIGLKPINNVVDITNFILFETGQPLHAFDYDKIAGKEIIVRTAKEKEKITTIDKVERELKNTILVIADSKKPIAIAGIMGGLNTEVTASTKNILLEAADFNQLSVRRSCRYLGLNTDSSYRFERGVNNAAIDEASERAASLICDIANAKTHKKALSSGTKKSKTTTIMLRPKKVKHVLGVKISTTAIKRILKPLGFETKQQNNVLKVSVPCFREDVKREIDVIEEIARIYGYNNTPSILPRAIITDELEKFKRKNTLVQSAQNTLTGLGFNEIMTYSLLSKQDLVNANASDIDTISVRNPLSDQQEVMRTTLMPGILKAINYNINMNNSNIKLFEISNIYFQQEAKLKQQQNLVFAVSGSSVYDWNKNQEQMNIFYLKGILKTLFDSLNIKVSFEETQHPGFEDGETMAVLSSDKMLGIIGKISSRVQENFNIKTPAYAAEISMPGLAENFRAYKQFKQFSRFPKSERDISMYVNIDIVFADIKRTIKQSAGSILKNIELKEEYKGKQVPQGQRSLLIKLTYQSDDRTLREEEIERSLNTIKEKLVQELNVELR